MIFGGIGVLVEDSLGAASGDLMNVSMAGIAACAYPRDYDRRWDLIRIRVGRIKNRAVERPVDARLRKVA
jgi:hypothetical protein